MSRATEAAAARLESLVLQLEEEARTLRVIRHSDLADEPQADASLYRALLAERTELLKDRALADWFEANQSRIALEGCGAIAVAPMDLGKEPDWDKADCFQVGDNGRCVHPTIPVNPTLRKTVAYLIDAATPPKSEAP